MTDSVTSQKLKDHAAAWAYKFTNESWYRDWETDRKSTRLNSSH